MKLPAKHWREDILEVLEKNVGLDVPCLPTGRHWCQYCQKFGCPSCLNCPLSEYEFNCWDWNGPYQYFMNYKDNMIKISDDLINAAWCMYSVLYFIEESEK